MKLRVIEKKYEEKEGNGNNEDGRLKNSGPGVLVGFGGRKR